MNKFEKIIEESFRDNFHRHPHGSQCWKGEWWSANDCESVQNMIEEIKRKIKDIRSKKEGK